jgi:ABC-2 type transport system ATP-binding protein
VDQLLRVLAEDRGCTVFFSSHQLEEVEQIAEYVGVIENGQLMVESRLDDIKSDFRLITAAGDRLPAQTSEQILSVDVERNFYRYVITKDADGFVARLSGDGATITNVAPLSLREIFLRLVGKE